MVDVEIVTSRLSDECGCLEEDIIIGMVFVTIHLEGDGYGEAFLDYGE